MKSFAIVTALIEIPTGLLMIIIPSLLVSLLFGTPISTPVEQVLGRIAGVPILALGTACWLARYARQNVAARGLVSAMALHNTGIAVILIYADLGLGLSGIGIWPVVLLHAAMAVWSVVTLQHKLVPISAYPDNV